jgi:hypothetical protein
MSASTVSATSFSETSVVVLSENQAEYMDSAKYFESS